MQGRVTLYSASIVVSLLLVTFVSGQTGSSSGSGSGAGFSTTATSTASTTPSDVPTSSSTSFDSNSPSTTPSADTTLPPQADYNSTNASSLSNTDGLANMTKEDYFEDLVSIAAPSSWFEKGLAPTLFISAFAGGMVNPTLSTKAATIFFLAGNSDCVGVTTDKDPGVERSLLPGAFGFPTLDNKSTSRVVVSDVVWLLLISIVIPGLMNLAFASEWPSKVKARTRLGVFSVSLWGYSLPIIANLSAATVARSSGNEPLVLGFGGLGVAVAVLFTVVPHYILWCSMGLLQPPQFVASSLALLGERQRRALRAGRGSEKDDDEEEAKADASPPQVAAPILVVPDQDPNKTAPVVDTPQQERTEGSAATVATQLAVEKAPQPTVVAFPSPTSLAFALLPLVRFLEPSECLVHVKNNTALLVDWAAAVTVGVLSAMGTNSGDYCGVVDVGCVLALASVVVVHVLVSPLGRGPTAGVTMSLAVTVLGQAMAVSASGFRRAERP